MRALNCLLVLVVATLFFFQGCAAHPSRYDDDSKSNNMFSTKWSLNLGINATTILSASSSDKNILLVVASGKSAITGINATTGATLYSIPAGRPDTQLTQLKVNNEHDLIITSHTSMNPITQQINVYHLKNGSSIFSLLMHKEDVASIGPHSIFLSTAFGTMTSGMNFLSYKLTTGALELNVTTHKIDSSIEVALSDSGIAILAGPPGGGEVGIYMFDKTTGAYRCKYPGWYGSISGGIPLVGDIISTGEGHLLNTTDCTTVSANFTGQVSLFGDSLYDWHSGSGAKLTRYNDHIKKIWSTPLAAPPHLAGRFFSVTSTGFNSDAIIVNNKGTFAALNKTSGAVMWSTTTAIPFGPPNANGQQVYPLGHHNLFVPNLQGYVILDTRHGGTVKVIDEHSPLTKGSYSFMDGQKPFVVFGDLTTGTLKAVELA